jgi:hypothetical protein
VPIPDPKVQARAHRPRRATCRARSTRRSGCRFHPRCPIATDRLPHRGAAAAPGRPTGTWSPATSPSDATPCRAPAASAVETSPSLPTEADVVVIGAGIVGTSRRLRPRRARRDASR